MLENYLVSRNRRKGTGGMRLTPDYHQLESYSSPLSKVCMGASMPTLFNSSRVTLLINADLISVLCVLISQ